MFSSWFGQKREEPKTDFVRVCKLFCCLQKNLAIIVSTSNHGGLIIEQEDGARQCALSQVPELGTHVKTALAECVLGGDFDLSRKKKTDWPAFWKSGYKTVKAFEKDFIQFMISGNNSSNVFYTVQTPELGQFSMRLNFTVDAYAEPAKFGTAVNYALERFLKVQSLGDNA
jgi:hypothetical protein